MLHYTLAGPDIGIQKLDLAGLIRELGDEKGPMVAAEAKESILQNLPATSPRRVFRIYKQGDEKLEWAWVAKRLPPDEEPDTSGNIVMETVREVFGSSAKGAEPEEPQPHWENQAVDMRFGQPQHLYTIHTDPGGEDVKLFNLAGRAAISVVFQMIVRARTEEEAKEAMRCISDNRKPPLGVEYWFEPMDMLARAGVDLKLKGSFDEAGFELTPIHAQQMTHDEVKRILFAQVREEHNEVVAQAAGAAMTLEALMDRRMHMLGR